MQNTILYRHSDARVFRVLEEILAQCEDTRIGRVHMSYRLTERYLEMVLVKTHRKMLYDVMLPRVVDDAAPTASGETVRIDLRPDNLLEFVFEGHVQRAWGVLDQTDLPFVGERLHHERMPQQVVLIRRGDYQQLERRNAKRACQSKYQSASKRAEDTLRPDDSVEGIGIYATNCLLDAPIALDDYDVRDGLDTIKRLDFPSITTFSRGKVAACHARPIAGADAISVCVVWASFV